MRMKPYIPSHVRVLGRGEERAHNGLRYRKYFDWLEIIVIFLGDTDVTGKDGAESPSTITEFVDDKGNCCCCEGNGYPLFNGRTCTERS